MTGGRVGLEVGGPEDVLGGGPEDKVPFPEVVLPSVVEGVALPTLREPIDVWWASAVDDVATLSPGRGDVPAPGGARCCRAI